MPTHLGEGLKPVAMGASTAIKPRITVRGDCGFNDRVAACTAPHEAVGVIADVARALACSEVAGLIRRFGIMPVLPANAPVRERATMPRSPRPGGD